MFVRRVDYLRNRLLDGAAPIELNATAPFSTRDQTKHFHQFVTESKLPWSDYRPLLRRPYALYDFDGAGNLIEPSRWKESCLRVFNWIAPH